MEIQTENSKQVGQFMNILRKSPGSHHKFVKPTKIYLLKFQPFFLIWD